MDEPAYNAELLMKRCLQLAEMGLPSAFPNPLVGCVIEKDGRIIGEGYHKNFGGPHAEVNAINSVIHRVDLKGATLCVNLEPCSHFGKTPPCSDLIIQMGIKKTVISCTDPNPLVSGRGIQKLKEAGIEIITGLLEENARELNKRFFTFHEKKRPYIILKWAQTADGFIARIDGSSKWISNEYSRKLVHKWRSEEAAILIGTKTALKDNPKLTTRLWSGKNPMRIVIDRDLKLPDNLEIFSDGNPTIVFNNNFEGKKEQILYLKAETGESFEKSILKRLWDLGIQSVIVEGGAFTLQRFIELNLWDEARVFVSSGIFSKGLRAPVPPVPYRTEKIANDELRYFLKS